MEHKLGTVIAQAPGFSAPACVAAIANYYGDMSVKQQHVASLMGDPPFELWQVADALRELTGIATIVLPSTLELVEFLWRRNASVVVSMNGKKKDETNYAVVTAVEDHRVLLMDPRYSTRVAIARDSFVVRWGVRAAIIPGRNPHPAWNLIGRVRRI